MIDMEIDFHSSLYCRSTTPNSMKRARSPELGPADRPLKRPILVLSRPSSTEYLTFRPPRSSPDLVNTHPVLDDWVSKAGYLSIDSPLMIAAISDSEHSNVDGDTSMDDSQDAYSNTKPLQTFSINIENTQSRLLESRPRGQLNDDSGYYTPAPSPHSLYTKRSFSSDNASTFSAASGASQLSSTEGGYQISTAVSPGVVLAELRTPRKPRFSMGPRADCDLCRQGIKGHSAHWSS